MQSLSWTHVVWVGNRLNFMAKHKVCSRIEMEESFYFAGIEFTKEDLIFRDIYKKVNVLTNVGWNVY